MASSRSSARSAITNPRAEVPDYDVLDYLSLTKPHTTSTSWQYVKPGVMGEEVLKASRVWNRGGVKGQVGSKGNMPPPDWVTDLSAADKKLLETERVEVLQKWLEAGSPPFIFSERPKAIDPGDLTGNPWDSVRGILETCAAFEVCLVRASVIKG